MFNRFNMVIGMMMALFLSQAAQANEAIVIEVRKKVKLHRTEKVYNDYFINGGTKIGLDKGSIVSVVRRVPVHDPFQNSAIGDFRIKVADIEIIHSDTEKSIGRLVGIDRRAERPMLRFDSVMIGDRLDLETLRSKATLEKETAHLILPPDPMSDNLRMPASLLVGDELGESGPLKEEPMKKQEAVLTNEQP